MKSASKITRPRDYCVPGLVPDAALIGKESGRRPVSKACREKKITGTVGQSTRRIAGLKTSTYNAVIRSLLSYYPIDMRTGSSSAGLRSLPVPFAAVLAKNGGTDSGGQ